MNRFTVLNASMVVLATAFGLVMVFREPRDETIRHSVAEYRVDAQLRHEVFTRCADDPGTLGRNPDCVNAREAERLESRGSLREQPALGFGSSPR